MSSLMKKLDQLIQEKAQRQKHTSRKISPENAKRTTSRSTSKNVSSPQNTIKLLEQHTSWLEAAKKEALSRSQYESLEKSTRERVLSQRKNQPHYAQPTQSMKIREDLNHQPISADHSFHSRGGPEDRLNQTMFAGKLDTSYQNDTSVSYKSTRLGGTPFRPHQRTHSQPKTPLTNKYSSVSAAHSRKPSNSPKPSYPVKPPASRATTPQKSLKPPLTPPTKAPNDKPSSRAHSPKPSAGIVNARAVGRKDALPLKNKTAVISATTGMPIVARDKSKTPVKKNPPAIPTIANRFGVPLVQKLTPIGKGRSENPPQKSPARTNAAAKSTAAPQKNPTSEMLQRTGSPCFDDLPSKLMQQVSTNAPLVSPRDSLDHSGFVHLETLSENGMFSGKGQGSHDSDASDYEEDKVVDPNPPETLKNKSYRYADWDLAQSAKQSKRVSAVNSTRNSWDKKPKIANEVPLQIDHLFKKDSGGLKTGK